MFETTEYACIISFQGDAEAALETAKTALLGQGFEIVRYSQDELAVRGSGMNSTREPPIRGASELAITVRQSEIELHARLGGVARMKAFLYLFPLGMAVMFLVGFGLAFGSRLWWAYPLPLAPWLVLSPVLARWVENRTKRALDGLLRSVEVTARHGAAG